MYGRTISTLVVILSFVGLVVGLTSHARAQSPGLSLEAQQALAHISQREGIAIDHLVLVNEFDREAPLLNQSFRAVTVLDETKHLFFKVLVDRSTLQVTDREVVEVAEQQAQRTQYGKLQPALHARLQQLGDNDLVSVFIVAATGPGLSQDERDIAAQDILAAKYPEARAARERSGLALDVDSPELAEQLRQEYRALLDASVEPITEPLVHVLGAEGFPVNVTAGLPGVWTTIPKRFISVLEARTDVGTIFWDDQQPPQLALDSAIRTNRANLVYPRTDINGRSIDGSGTSNTGVAISILEPGTVDFDKNNNNSSTGPCPPGTNNCFRRPGPVRRPLGATPTVEDNHATLVASAAASNHPSSYKGMAYGAYTISAGTGILPEQSFADALKWSIDQSAKIINVSAGYKNDRLMRPVDFAFDHYARQYFVLPIAAAGNLDNFNDLNVISPGIAWNTLTVGNYNDNGDDSYAGDAMAGGSRASNYIDPLSTDGDKEKPEVVAPGVNITGITTLGRLIPESGTSFSAPQVAGQAALMVHRNRAVESWPSAIRAIIMATAIHNIEGDTGMPSGKELRDGAGGINADLSDKTTMVRGTHGTDCNQPCWWGDSINFDSFHGTGYRFYRFFANQNDRVRIAIAWFASAGCATSDVTTCSSSLATDLDVALFAPGGNAPVANNAYNASWDNNYELIPSTGDIVIPETGVYSIGVYRKRFDQDINYLGVAWTKFASSNNPAPPPATDPTPGVVPTPQTIPTVEPIGPPPPNPCNVVDCQPTLPPTPSVTGDLTCSPLPPLVYTGFDGATAPGWTVQPGSTSDRPYGPYVTGADGTSHGFGIQVDPSQASAGSNILVERFVPLEAGQSYCIGASLRAGDQGGSVTLELFEPDARSMLIECSMADPTYQRCITAVEATVTGIYRLQVTLSQAPGIATMGPAFDEFMLAPLP